MAPSQEDIEQDDIRQRVRDQVRLIREPTREVSGGADAVVSDTEDDADRQPPSSFPASCSATTPTSTG